MYCKQHILDTIYEIIKKHDDGFTIIEDSVELDGCDKYGEMYWVDCKNGWSGREHFLQTSKDEYIKDEVEKLMENIKFTIKGYSDFPISSKNVLPNGDVETISYLNYKQFMECIKLEDIIIL
jgi:hypothetical protein